MSELIDREAVREFIKSYSHSTDVVYHMEKQLYEVPTIDAVPVVHGYWVTKTVRNIIAPICSLLFCKKDKVHYAKIVRCGECKYHLPETERTNPYCNRFPCMKPDDWYCADGEREVQDGQK